MARHKLPFIDTLPASTLQETKLHTILRQSPIHRMECLRVVDEIIENLDETGIMELMGGTEQDIDGIIENMLYDTYTVLYTGNRDIDFAPRYEQHISESIEEVLRCNNLTYFITSVIPDFQLSYHHLEWGDLVHHHKRLCIEAARDHGKCLAPDTLIRMADGSEKKASEIKMGDEVMGIDLLPRKVLEVHTGHDEHMYRITNGYKNSYIVNSQHTTTLLDGEKYGRIVDVDIPTLLKLDHEAFRGFEIDYTDKRNKKPFITENNIQYASNITRIKIEDMGEGDYVGFEIDGDHRFLLANGIVTHNSYYFSNAYLIWQLYKYAPPKVQQFSRRPTASNSNRGFLFSFSLQQAVDLIEILKGTIESNDILRERLYPDNPKEGAWASTNIVCKNGARLTGKGFGSSVRGAHPYYIVVDDGLKDNVIYSQLQRQKSIDYFHSVIMNMLVPGGQICVVGCVSPNTIVLSEKRGFIRMRNIKRLYYEDKKKVVPHKEKFLDKDGYSESSHFFYNGYGKMLRITLQGGYEIECSLIHPLWKMFESGIPGWEKSKNLQLGDYVAIKPTEIKDFGTPVDLSSFIHSYKQKKNRSYQEVNLKLPKYLDKDLAYFIGLWIAEGTIYKNGSGVEMSTGDEEIETFLRSLIKYNIKFRGSGRLDGSYAYPCTNRRLHNFMIWLGFDCPCHCNIKKIPEKLLSAPKEILAQVISGIFDGDGHVDCSGGKLGVILSSTSPELIKTIQSVLLMGWGIVSSYSYITAESINASGKNDTHVNFDQYSLCVAGKNAKKFFEEIGFRLTRKQSKYNPNIQIFESKSIFNNIPYQGKLFEAAEQKRLDAKISYRNKPGYDKDIESSYQIKKKHFVNKFYLKRVCEFMKSITNFTDYDQIIANCDEGIVWRKVIKIEEIEGTSCDFVIPSTHSFITNGIVSHNTPFHAQDLYGDLKSKSGWFCIEYPAIFPNGKILWPQRWSFKDLMDKRATQGNIIFSRENLCRPIVSDSSIFPLSILNNSIVRMDNYTLVRNRDSYVKKFNKVVCGCDFSISSSVGADFYFYTVFGIDEDNGMWLMNVEYGKGKTFHEQIQLLRTIHSNFRPDVMVFESNVFQQIFTDEGLKYGMPVVPHNTGVEKNDLSKGWCAIATAMERGLFHFPTGDEYSRKIKDEIFEQLGSVAFTDKGGIASVGSHDDACSSIWLSMLGRNISSFGFKFSFM